MAENSEEKVKELSVSDLKQSVNQDSSTPLKTLETEMKTPTAPKTAEEFRQFGRTYIENIKASLLSSSASFDREKYASTLEDPYMKAYRYLEENNVLALLEDLITYTAFQRPSEPFPFMAKLVEDFYADGEQKDTISSKDVSRK